MVLNLTGGWDQHQDQIRYCYSTAYLQGDKKTLEKLAEAAKGDKVVSAYWQKNSPAARKKAGKQ